MIPEWGDIETENGSHLIFPQVAESQLHLSCNKPVLCFQLQSSLGWTCFQLSFSTAYKLCEPFSRFLLVQISQNHPLLFTTKKPSLIRQSNFNECFLRAGTKLGNFHCRGHWGYGILFWQPWLTKASLYIVEIPTELFMSGALWCLRSALEYSRNKNRELVGG